MERRALLAAVLCLLVLVVYQAAVDYLYPPPPPLPPAVASPGSTPEVIPPGALPPVVQPPAAIPPAETVAEGDAGRIIAIETDLYAARLSATGGRIVSFRLKRFRAGLEAASEPLEMIEVAPGAAPPLGVRFLAADGKVEDDTAVVYAADRDALELAGSATGVITLAGTLPSGGRIEKTLAFAGDAYPIEITVRAPELPASFAGVGIGWRHQVVEKEGGDREAYYRGAIVLAGRKLVHELASSLSGQPPRAFEGPVGWAGYADHYFLAVLLPEEPAQARAVISPESAGVQVLLTSPRPAPEAPVRFTLFVGPKDVELLESLGRDLERAADFGWFSFLAIPLLKLLKLFHSATGNYGLDIILLTIVVKVLFIPLTNKSMKSMRDMQRLQPQMAKLREKFKDDRERLNKEMIELYRRHRVNPLGGCLPMLLQFPVFIGLYQGLSGAIELRHAPFALWIRDLSTHECYPWPGQTLQACNDLSLLGLPIPLLVLLMGGSMILQQWLTPATGMDPVQQRMMMVLMPVMFTVMFVTFPSGLVLYWLVNNVLTIAQQWWTNRAQPA
jgi:YidC/Oxa1 family membrane protein insertase